MGQYGLAVDAVAFTSPNGKVKGYAIGAEAGASFSLMQLVGQSFLKLDYSTVSGNYLAEENEVTKFDDANGMANDLKRHGMGLGHINAIDMLLSHYK